MDEPRVYGAVPSSYAKPPMHRGRRCVECKVFWESLDVNCWMCGKRGEMNRYPTFTNRAEWKAERDAPGLD